MNVSACESQSQAPALAPGMLHFVHYINEYLLEQPGGVDKAQMGRQETYSLHSSGTAFYHLPSLLRKQA